MANVLTPKSIDELQRGFYRLAKFQPDRCFQGMYDAICREDVLQHAYLVLRADNISTSGVDDKSLADIAIFGARKWLKELAMDLRGEIYQPAPLRRVSIPLPNGQLRTIDIPTFRDEVCMTATMLLVKPILAAWLTARSDTNLSPSHHLADDENWQGVLATNALSVANHDESGQFNYLAEVSRARLAQTIASRIADRRVANLFTMWLTCPCEQAGAEYSRRVNLATSLDGRRVSQDLPISPLLTYLVMLQSFQEHEDDRFLRSSPKGEIGNANLHGSEPPVIEAGSFGEKHPRNGIRNTQFGRALLISLLLHAALLALQFGEPGSGLPLFGLQDENREANISVLNATLLNNAAADISAPVANVIDMQKADPVIPSTLIPAPSERARSANLRTVQIKAFKAVVTNSEAEDRARAEPAVASPKSIKTRSAVANVLNTKSESTWSKNVDTPEAEGEASVIADSSAETKIAEEPRDNDQWQALALSTAERAQQAAAAKAQEDALARQRIEEVARNEAEKMKQANAAREKADDLARAEAEAERQRQAAMASAKDDALARQRADELARTEAEKAKQLLEAKAAAERSAKRVEMEAEAVVHARAIELAAQAKKIEAERSLAAERALAAQIAASPPATRPLPVQSSAAMMPVAGEAGREDSARHGAGTGKHLTGPVLDTARNSSSGLLPKSSPENQTPRRASILGRDPKDIQLAFYGEGWRQKVERVGAMNFPKLSKYLVYDPMVVTVSINSDGTLAGVRIVKSSGHDDLDDAVRRIVEMSAPFSAFPPDMKRSFDVADITRTWVFVGDRPRMSRE